MDNLNFKGTADFSQLFTEFDALEKRVADIARLPQIVIKPKLDLTSQLLQLDAYEKRLKRLGGLPVGQGQTPTQRPSTPPVPAVPVTVPQTTLTVAEALTKRLRQINNEAKILRSDFIAAGTAADVTDQEVAALQTRIQALRTELAQLRPIATQTFGASSAQVRGLALTTEQLQRTLAGATGQMSRLGIASQFKMAIDQTGAFNNPQGNINGIVQLVRGYEQARLSSQSFQKTLQRQNIEVDAAQQWIKRFSDRFNVVPSTIEATSKVLLNNGYTIDQARETMELYAASALVAAKDVGGAIDALGSDVQTQNTVLSNQYGIASNQASAYQQYAKSIGKTVEALTAEERAQGFLIALRREATNDLRDADTILEGVGGTLGETTAEFRNVQRELGEALLPAVANGAKQLTALLRQFNELDPAIKDSVANIVIWGTAFGAARIVIGPLFSLLKGGVPLFKKLGEVAWRAGAAGGLNAAGAAGANAAAGAAAAGRGLRDLSTVTATQGGLFSKLTGGLKGLTGGLGTAGNVAGQFIKTLAASPATKGGLYGAVFALGYGVGTLISKIKTLNGLTVGQNVENFSLKAFSGYTPEQINQLRIDEARNRAFNEVMTQQAEAVKKAREEKDLDLRSSKLRTLNLERDLAVEQAARQQAIGLGDRSAVLAIDDRIKNLTTALGLERQNRAVIDANILQEQRRQDLEEQRRPVLEALRKQQVELGQRSADIRIKAKSDFAADMGQIASDFRTQRKKLEMQLAGEKDIIIRAEIERTIGKLNRVNQQEVSARTAAEIKAGQGEIAAAQRAVEQARTSAMGEGVAQREAQLTDELNSIRDDYGPKIKAALENAQLVTGTDRKGFQQQAGQLQALQQEAERVAREGAGRELTQLREEERKKGEERVRAAREAEGRVITARAEAADGAASALEKQRDRELELYGQSAQGRLRVEQRYEGSLTQMRVEAAQLRAQGEASALKRTYDQQMTEARTAGAQRASLEASARREYLTKLGTLETASAQEIRDLQIKGQEDILKARLAVQQEALDGELKNIQTVTGAELASLQLRLEARRRAAIASDDVRSAEQFAAALRQVGEANTDRIRTFKGEVRDAAKSATDLRNRLAEAMPRTALQKTMAEAASPFNSVITEARSQLAALKKSFDLIGMPSAAQRRSYQQAIAVQQGIISDAQVARNRAVLQGQQEATREQLAAARSLAREELQADVRDGRTDAIRQQAKARLLALDKSRIEQITVELGLLAGRTGAEERIATLTRERLSLEGDVTAALADQRQDAAGLVDSELAIAQARADGATTLARTEEERQRARLGAAALAAQELSTAQIRLDVARQEGRSQTDINNLVAARDAAQTHLTQTQRTGLREQREDLDALADSELNITRTRVEGATSLARTQEEQAQARAGQVALAAIELNLAQRRLDLAESEVRPQAEINTLIAARDAAQTRFTQTQRTALREQNQSANTLASSLISLSRATVEQSETLARSDAQITGARQARVELAARELLLADQRITQAREEGVGEAELNDLLTARVGTVTQLVQAERALGQLARERIGSTLTDEQARAQAQGRILSLADDAVAVARVDLGLSRQRLAVVEGQLAAAEQLQLTEAELRDLGQERVNAQAQEAESLRAVAQAERDRVVLARDLAGALRDVGRTGGPKMDDLEAASRQVQDATEALQVARSVAAPDLTALANEGVFSPEALQRVRDLASAITAQRDAVRKLGEEYAKQVENVDALAGAIQNLTQTITPKAKSGGQPFSVQREAADLKRLEQRRELSLRGLESALDSGDPQKIAAALNKVNETEKLYREEVQRLQKEGYAPYLNLVDRQAGRVKGLVQQSQGVLDDLLAKGTENLKRADDLQKEADRGTGDSVPMLTAQAIERSLNVGSDRVSNQILDSLTSGGRIVAQAIEKALLSRAVQVTAPAPVARSVQPNVTEQYEIVLNVNNQEWPTMPTVNEIVKEAVPAIKQHVQNDARRSGRKC